MNDSREYSVGKRNKFFYDIQQFNGVIGMIFLPIVYLDFLCIFLLSISWAAYLIQKLLKDQRRHKQKIKQRNNLPDQVWKNALINFESNKIKILFLLAICLSECGKTFSLLFYGAIAFPLDEIHAKSAKFAVESQLKHIFQNGTVTYEKLVDLQRLRIAHYITSVFALSVLLCLRILSQYMVCKYSYYKSHLNIKLEVVISVYRLTALFIMGLFSIFVNIYNISIILNFIYDLILLLISSNKLSQLLKQRLSDAINHENQPREVIHYYIVASRDFKTSTTIFLTAFVIQNLGTLLYCGHPIIMGLIYYPANTYPQDTEKPSHVFTYSIEIYDLLINSLQLILMTLGLSIELSLYLIVSIRRMFRNILQRIRFIKTNPCNSHLLQRLIKENHDAYFRNSI